MFHFRDDDLTRDLVMIFFDEKQRNGQSPLAWTNVVLCALLMSHVFVLIELELYSLICSIVTPNRIVHSFYGLHWAEPSRKPSVEIDMV